MQEFMEKLRKSKTISKDYDAIDADTKARQASGEFGKIHSRFSEGERLSDEFLKYSLIDLLCRQIQV